MAAGSSEDITTVGWVLGTVVLLMLVALVAFWIQVHQLKHHPVDVTEMQTSLMQSLGLMAATSFGPTETGSRWRQTDRLSTLPASSRPAFKKPPSPRSGKQLCISKPVSSKRVPGSPAPVQPSSSGCS